MAVVDVAVVVVVDISFAVKVASAVEVTLPLSVLVVMKREVQERKKVQNKWRLTRAGRKDPHVIMSATSCDRVVFRETTRLADLAS